MSQGRKERTPAQLAVLAQAREKAKIVIAERAKLHAQAKKEAEIEPLSEDVAHPPEPLSEESHPPPLPPEPVSALSPLKEDSDSESESRLTRRELGEMIQRQRLSPKYRFVHGVGYIKIK